MLVWTDRLVLLLDALRRVAVHQRWLRLVLGLSGLLALLTLWVPSGRPLLGGLGLLLLVLSVIRPRGHLPTVFSVLVLLWAAAAVGDRPLTALPVALGLLGVHWAGGVAAVGRPWSRLQPGVLRPLLLPLLLGAGGLAVAVVLVLLLSPVVLPPLLAVTGALLVVLVGVVGLVVWPRTR